jgi:hypothetical protein
MVVGTMVRLPTPTSGSPGARVKVHLNATAHHRRKPLCAHASITPQYARRHDLRGLTLEDAAARNGIDAAAGCGINASCGIYARLWHKKKKKNKC